MTTFLLHLMESTLKDQNEFVPFTTTRPPKKNLIDNEGYSAVLRGGVWRIVVGIAITTFHVLKYPWAIVMGRIDIVQVQASDFQVFWESMVYVVMSRALGRPVLLRIGGSFDRFYSVSGRLTRRLLRWAIKVPDVLIIQSEYWRSFMEGLGRTKDVVIVNNFVPEESIVQEQKRGFQEPPVFCFLAGLEARRKGVDVLIEAVKLLQERGVEFIVQMIAAPPMLVGRIAQEGLAQTVRTTGYLDHSETLSKMYACDALLLPSLAEGFPNTLLEGMAKGLPVIASSVGAIPEVLSVGEGGILVPPNNAEALADAMARLAQDAELRRRMGRSNISTVRERFVPRVALSDLGKAYERFCD